MLLVTLLALAGSAAAARWCCCALSRGGARGGPGPVIGATRKVNDVFVTQIQMFKSTCVLSQQSVTLF
jgi:hypothetical protein